MTIFRDFLAEMSLAIRDIKFSKIVNYINHVFIDQVALEFYNYLEPFRRRYYYKITLFREFAAQMSL